MTSLDGSTRLSKRQLMAEALHLHNFMRGIQARVEGLKGCGSPVTMFLAVDGLMDLKASAVGRPLTSLKKRFVFSRPSEAGINIRLRDYTLSPFDRAVRLNNEDLEFLNTD